MFLSSKKVALTSVLMIVAAGLSLAVVAPAQAATPSPVPNPVTSSSGITADTTIPAVQVELARIEAAGGTVLSSQTVPFHAMGKSTASVTPMSLPNGCGLSVFIYKSGARVYSDSLTSCPGAYASAYMDSTIDKFDVFWGIWTGPVASHNVNSFSASSFTNLYYYSCPTSNSSGFRTTTDGGMSYGGSDYYASAYDVSSGSLTCG